MRSNFNAKFLSGLFSVVTKPFFQLVTLLCGLVAGFLILFVSGLLVNPIFAVLIVFALGTFVILFRLTEKRVRMSITKRKARMLLKKARPLTDQNTFTSWLKWKVNSRVGEAIELARKESFNEELVIGRIDNDGRVFGLFGELPGLENITQDEFVRRYRYPLDIVLKGDNILLRKKFGRDRVNFLREWYNLCLLFKKANVPAIYCVDESSCVLYKSFIPGKTLRDILVDAGAKILNIQTDNDSELANLKGNERLEAILGRGTAFIPFAFPKKFLFRMEKEMDKIHSAGVAKLSLTFGNIIMDAKGEPWFIDFEGAHSYRSTSSLFFAYRRNQDRIKFSKIYDHTITKNT